MTKNSYSNSKALFFTGHNAFGPRKASVHFIAENLVKLGFDCGIVTVRLSWLSKLKHDGRYEFAKQRPFNQWLETPDRVRSFVWYSPFHPYNLHNRLANLLVAPLYALYPYFMPRALVEDIKTCTHIFVESGLPALLMQRLLRLAPQATFVYLAADRMALLNVHPLIARAEHTYLQSFRFIRMAAEAQKPDFEGHPNAQYISHGIDKEVFDKDYPNPYKTLKNVIVIGGMLFDEQAVQVFAEAFPDYTFHLFGGEIVIHNPAPNIIMYGEKPFSGIVPYIKHADIGLAPYKNQHGAEYLSQSSLKLIQYTYCQLPILAPRFTETPSRPHICGYDLEDAESVRSGFLRAVAYPRDSISRTLVRSWREVAEAILVYLR